MKSSSKILRRVEIALWVLGVSLLGVVFGDTLARWNYQAQQERALERGPAVFAHAPARNHEIPIAPRSAVRAPGVETAASPLVVVAKQTESDVAPRVEDQKPSTPPVAKKRRAPEEESVDFDPTSIGRIEIPRIGIAAFVKEGADEGTLALAVGRVPGSARPGELGNMVLAGHRDTFFRPLRKIKVNDRIRMIVPPNTYEYRVQSMRVVAPEETSVLQSNGVEELTLVTCYPFRFIGSAPERFIVSAARVN